MLPFLVVSLQYLLYHITLHLLNNCMSDNTKTCTLTSVGLYTLLHEIGSGSFGQVRLAKGPDGLLYAIKIISLSQIKNANLESQLKREIKVLRRLSHPNVVRLIEVLKNKKFVFLVTEFIDGGDLFDYLVKHGQVSETTARSIFKQMVAGVLYCHACKVVQRDLKVENILLTKNGTVKLADFGFSNIIDTDEYLKTVCGTPSCIAPEILRHEPYTASVDIFSMAVVLFQLCAGRLPFDGETNEDIFDRIMAMEYSCPEHFSMELQELIGRAFVLDGEERITLLELEEHPWMTKEEEPEEQRKGGPDGEEAKRPAEDDLAEAATANDDEEANRMQTLLVHRR
jgi:serine/threonine protein kinase